MADGGASGVRARVGTGAAIVGAGEFERGVDVGVKIGSDGLREE